MQINAVRDKLINYEVFLQGQRKLGMADVTLPEINYKAHAEPENKNFPGVAWRGLCRLSHVHELPSAAQEEYQGGKNQI